MHLFSLYILLCDQFPKFSLYFLINIADFRSTIPKRSFHTCTRHTAYMLNWARTSKLVREGEN